MGRALTIRSSRDRFTAANFSGMFVLVCGRAAARLNSGVRSLMKAHRPNHVPKRTRMLLALAIIAILLYATAHLVTGYVYIPSKRGGVLLSGASTLMIVLAQLFIVLGCAAKIVDHYDTRPNEHKYQQVRRTSFKFSLTLFLLAPFAQLVVALLHIADVHVPNFPGLANQFTFSSPSLKAYDSILSLDKSMLLPLGAAGTILLLVGWLAAKFELDSSGRVQMLLIGLGLLLISILCMNILMHDLLIGQTELGRRSHRTLVTAVSDPAKFNAVLLTNFSVFGLIFIFSLLALLGGLVGTSSKQRWQGFWKSFQDQ